MPHRCSAPAELIDALWDEDPPATARGQLQTCVSRLRRVLPAGAIRTEPAGYRFAPRAGELDAVVFARLVGAGPGAARDAASCSGRRSTCGADRRCAEIESPRGAAGRRGAGRAAGGGHRGLGRIWSWPAGRDRDLLGELAGLVERFPLRERLRGQLMVALHRSGRQADALAEFRRARELLRDELGIEPGRELQDLHRRILAGRVVRRRRRPAAPSRVRCLPRTVGDFTGRRRRSPG